MYNVTTETLNLIKQFEGYRSKAYKCAGGVWTIGYGTTKLHNRPVREGDTITEKLATEYLKEYVKDLAKELCSLNRSFNQNEVTALLSFIYNCGLGRTMTKAIESGDRNKIIETMSLYVNAGGKRNEGLVMRRKKEIEIFRGAEKEDHVQLNYQPNHVYYLNAKNMNVRHKPHGRVLYQLSNCAVLNKATTRVGCEIWGNISGTDNEEWICFDDGNKQYVK